MNPITFRAGSSRIGYSGIGLIETMIGLAIGLLASAVILQTFLVSEGFRRNTTSAGDAQQNGLFSTFTLARELANAGNDLAASGRELGTCPNTNDVATTLRPIPVLITADPSDAKPDTFVVHYGVSSILVSPAALVAAAPAGAAFQVQSPAGFARDDMIVAISRSGQCERARATAVSAPDGGGVVTINHTGMAQDFGATSRLLTLGPWDRVQRVQYAVSNGVLRSLDLTNADATPNPMSSDIVNMKVQYGIDTNADGLLDAWVKATQPPWTSAVLMGAAWPVINQIKAVRIGMIVRGPQYDRTIDGDFRWVLFDCDEADKTKCPGRLAGTIARDAGGGGYRYRSYETIVPLRNPLWNKQR
ncbi:MAG: PilW family protein [Betaproteobacteria bacterium]